MVLAFGRDEAGRRLAQDIQALAPMVRMTRHAPELGARWADQMQLERRHVASLQRTRPAIERESAVGTPDSSSALNTSRSWRMAFL